jgi:hypothetical protein
MFSLTSRIAAFFLLSIIVSCVPDVNQDTDKEVVSPENQDKMPNYVNEYLRKNHPGFEIQEFAVNADSSVQVDFYADECRGALTFRDGVCKLSQVIFSPEIMPEPLKAFIKQRHPDSTVGLYSVAKTADNTVHSIEIPDGSYSYSYTFDASYKKLTEERFEANEEELNDVTGSGSIVPEDSLGE